ncbi:MAG: elongation factor G [Actinobacteria bacterium]|nr:elongation factor G [Actinomycetota bacterium]MCL6087617.1 elongation factor G [Actinomycetota bacterium]
MAVSNAENKRVIGLVSGNNTGKTTLAECFLFDSGAIERMGRIETKNTVSDFSPLETKRGFSISSSILNYQWKEHLINLIDCPGYLDFIGQTLEAIQVIDGALLLFDPKASIQAVTEKIIEELDKKSTPVFCIMNKLDQENADYFKAIENIKKNFSAPLVPFTIPSGEGENFNAVIDVLKKTQYTYKTDLKTGTKSNLDDSISKTANAGYNSLIEYIVENDEVLLEKYLNGEEIDAESLNKILKKSVLNRSIIPVFAISAGKNIGIDILMDYINTLMPSPVEISKIKAREINSNNEVEINMSADSQLAAYVFKTTADPFIGKLSVFRIFSGTMKPANSYFVSGPKNSFKFTNIMKMQGKNQSEISEASPGDMVAVAKITDISTDDTISSPEKPLAMNKVIYPEPIFPRAIMPAAKGDEEKINAGITRLIEEDPTIRLENNLEVKQSIVWGMGELHLAIVREKLKEKFDIDVNMEIPRVAYKETIRNSAKSEYKYKKQSGGRGQYGHVFIEIKPLAKGEGFKFEDTIFGGAIPKGYIPGVEKGIREALQAGILGGFPVVDVSANLYDGSYHTVDSSEMAFKIAASMAFKKGMSEAAPVILEPVMELEITVPEEYMGDIIGDINSKRGKIISITGEKHNQIIKATVPQSETFNYAVDLKSMTQGRGIFKQKFSHYDELPHNLAESIIEERKKQQENHD